MNKRYNLTASNFVLLILVVLATVGSFVLMHGSNLAPVAVTLAATLMGILLVPAAAAWLVWLATGRRKKGGSWTFNLVMLLTAAATLHEPIEQGLALVRDVESGPSDRPRATATSPGNSTPAVQRETTIAVGATASGDGTVDTSGDAPGDLASLETEVREIVDGSAAKLAPLLEEWGSAFAAVRSEGLPNYRSLDAEEDYDRQRGILVRYQSASAAYLEAVEGINAEIDHRCVRLDAIGGARTEEGETIQRLRDHQRTFAAILEGHVDHAVLRLTMLEALEVGHSEWSYDEGSVHGEDADFLAYFRGLESSARGKIEEIDLLMREATDRMR